MSFLPGSDELTYFFVELASENPLWNSQLVRIRFPLGLAAIILVFLGGLEFSKYIFLELVTWSQLWYSTPVRGKFGMKWGYETRFLLWIKSIELHFFFPYLLDPIPNSKFRWYVFFQDTTTRFPTIRNIRENLEMVFFFFY